MTYYHILFILNWLDELWGQRKFVEPCCNTAAQCCNAIAMRQGLRPSDTEVARNARHGMLEDDLWFIYDHLWFINEWFVMISPRAVWCTMCLTGDGSFEKAKVVVISRYQPLSSSSRSSSPPSITFIVMSWLRYVRLCFYGHCCLVWTLLKCPPSYCSFRPLPMASSLVHRIHLH